MFRVALSEHQRRLEKLSQRQERCHQAALYAAASTASIASNQLNSEVGQIYDNQKRIEEEVKLVKDELARFQANVGNLSSLVRQVHHALKEVGDFENYLSVVEEQVDRVGLTAQSLMSGGSMADVPLQDTASQQ
mmetsp:Transcript_77/g.125  ORF Transcript_77/g.125 Transcript_77/m.125 type:complete len:134 (-) Transcript_77:1016-1417(-)